jgi:alcohol dehydrogenase (NADP+)
MKQADNLKYRKLLLSGGSGRMPALGFGTLIADATETRIATKAALDAGFRHLDCAERYRNEEQVGEAIRESIRGGSFARGDLFVTTKLWNSNHRPERVKPAFEASRSRLQVDYIDLYLIHTPFAFQPGDNQDPRGADGNVIYDYGVTLMDTWRAMEGLLDSGKLKAIGLSDVSLEQVEEVVASATVKPAVVQVESHPYLPQTELLEFCNRNGIVMLAFAPLGHGMKPGVLEDPVVVAIAKRVNQTPAQVLLAWAVQRGTAVLTTPKTPARAKENFSISALPEDAIGEINAIQTRQRLNLVTGTGIPGFIAKGN